MVTITCKTKDCKNENIDVNFEGEPKFVICGHCLSQIEGTDLRPDPEITSEV
jgi:hypothetical protein